ncbi:4-(cytidine 5'-diphospho)-2-C-methyl-D-erythritol kinase [Oceaniserpentilla sp. 4NH20-0058]|uniref:4-(cytidine 5'-diphospho)-2-C-methyl-D-erythritol kinase n=1 Tax=Oceaniserpentilla sp. 4NH20-0058 TaxID=3127660 RepID=UPI0031023926
MTSLKLPSPAKLNLFLHITGQRPDGYHELQTIFQFIDRCDELTLSTNHTGTISITPAIEGVALEDNLIYKAAKILQEKTGCRQGAHIQLNKILPMGGGLGGGSSNAATALVGLNQLWETQLSEDELAELGLQLGSDVPVFVRGQAAWAQGVGETLIPLDDLEENWFVVVVPACHVNTAEIFSHKDLTRDTPTCRISAALRGEGRNDCESVVCKLHQEVSNSLNLLKKIGSARMTGTGACVFLELNSEKEANSVLAKLPADTEAFVAKGINQSPMQKALNS